MSLRAIVPFLLSGCVAQEGFVLPLADAGSAVSGEPGQTVYLDGGDSDAVTWSWRFASLPAASQLLPSDLHDADTPWPTFVADVPGLYTLELSACDAQGRCATDQVQVAAGAVYKPLMTTPSSGVSLGLGLGHDPNNQAPTAQAQLRSLRGATPHILLNGSGSSDPDGDTLYYRWSFVSRPAGSALSSADINDRDDVTASVTPDVAGEYTLRLWVSDGRAQDSVVLPPVTVTDRMLDDWEPIEY